LTGFEASIMRAVVMGIGALLGMVTGRKVKIFGSLLLSAVILLIINPLWLTYLGFQLSFLATLGLVITAPAIEKKLDWLPPTIAGLIAVPLAASLWTLPLTIYVFNTIAIYSIVANIITTPLIALISLGSMISAFMGLIYPVLGSVLAWLMYYPTNFLLGIIEFFANLPGSSLSIGKISLGVLLLIYLGYGLVLSNKWWQRRWVAVVLFLIIIVIIPIWYRQSNLIQVTVLANGREPIVVMQDKGKTALLGVGGPEDIDYLVLPFLRQQAINHLDFAITLHPKQKEFWENLTNIISVGQFYSNLTANQEIFLGDSKIALLSNQPSILNLNISGNNWLLLIDQVAKNREKIQPFTLPAETQQNLALIWSGKTLNPQWLEIIKPQVAIASSNSLDINLQQELKQRKIDLYWTGRDGAIQWALGKGFVIPLEEPFLG
jgi:competence protein ComEC